MGFFSSIGGLVGGLISAPLAIGGALLGGVLDGNKARKAQQAQINEQNRIATIAAENASRPVVTTQKVDFEGLQELLPHYCKVTENIVDEDDDCGTLYNYNITDDRVYG